jgi:hypothetical protein
MYNGFESQDAFHNAMAEAWTNPASGYQQYLTREFQNDEKIAAGRGWQRVNGLWRMLPNHNQIAGDILGGSGD